MAGRPLHRVILAAIFGVVLLAGERVPVAAEKLEPPVIAIVDMQRVLRESIAAQDMRQRIESHRTEFQTNINQLDESLRAEEQELKRQQAILAPEAFSQKRRQFEEKVTEVQRSVQERIRALDLVLAQATREIEKALVPILIALSEERGFDIAMASNQFIFATKSLDITDEVLTRLNEQLPTVSVTLPSVD